MTSKCDRCLKNLAYTDLPTVVVPVVPNDYSWEYNEAENLLHRLGYHTKSSSHNHLFFDRQGSRGAGDRLK